MTKKPRQGGRKKAVEEYWAESEEVPAPYPHLEKPCRIHCSTGDKVARVVYQLRHGKIDSSRKFVCHHCDRNRCIEDSHVYLGDHASNMRDMSVRNRTGHPPQQKEATAASNRARKGVWKVTSETRLAQLHDQMAGENNPQYGKRGELATCYGRTGAAHPMYGKKHTPEAREKAIAGARAYWAQPGVREAHSAKVRAALAAKKGKT